MEIRPERAVRRPRGRLPLAALALGCLSTTAAAAARVQPGVPPVPGLAATAPSLQPSLQPPPPPSPQQQPPPTRQQQPPPSPARPHADAQESYEPHSVAGAGQALLAKFAGDWDVVKTFFPLNGAPVRTAGECRQRMIHDGHFLESSFAFFDQDGGKTTGTGISGFDPKAGQFTTVWFDSRQTTMSMRQSQGTFDGKELVLYGATLGGEPSRRSITRTHLEEDGRVLVHRHYLVQDDGKERLMMELRLTRKRPPVPVRQ
jgi:hypothetical protein